MDDDPDRWPNAEYVHERFEERGRLDVTTALAAVDVEWGAEQPVDLPMIAAFREAFEKTVYLGLDVRGDVAGLRQALAHYPRGSSAAVGALAAHVLGSDAISTHVPELQVPTGEVTRLLAGAAVIAPLALEAELAVALNDGGAYVSIAAGRARDLATEFRRSIFAERYDDAFVLDVGPYCGWFRRDGWDHGWLVTDLGAAHIYLLCATSTD